MVVVDLLAKCPLVETVVQGLDLLFNVHSGHQYKQSLHSDQSKDLQPGAFRSAGSLRTGRI